MRFSIRHPKNPRCRAQYGWDSSLGFFVHVFHGHEPAEQYDARTANYRAQRPLEGALDALIAVGFLSRDDLEEALELATNLLPEEMPRAAARAARVVNNFKKAAD